MNHARITFGQPRSNAAGVSRALCIPQSGLVAAAAAGPFWWGLSVQDLRDIAATYCATFLAVLIFTL